MILAGTDRKTGHPGTVRGRRCDPLGGEWVVQRRAAAEAVTQENAVDIKVYSFHPSGIIGSNHVRPLVPPSLPAAVR